jgi:signal transduction histidine kinase
LDIILTNLIGNALDASRPGDHVSIDVRTEGNNYVIAISNSLPVPVEIRDRFFEKYATAGKVGGTGIGTYSAAIMTKAIGGRIEMNTSEDTGTTVSVSIPLLSGANE